MTIEAEVRQLRQRVVTLTEALESAVTHLEYCGYGDKWERECAEHDGLPQKLEQALRPTTEK